MNTFQAIVLGIVQGVTEFLPVSSTAHLVLVPALLGWNLDSELMFVFDVLVQVGTIFAVIVYFWRDWWGIVRSVVPSLRQRVPYINSQRHLLWMIMIATIPAVIFGLMLKDFFEEFLGNSRGVALLLLCTSALLVLGERFSGEAKRVLTNITWVDALIIGLFQALAILPGISRSGSTISGGLLRGLDRATAARFSFLLAVPVMLGAGAMAVRELLYSESMAEHLRVIVVGFVVAAVVGFISLRWLLYYLGRHSMHVFAVYCTAVGLVALLAGCNPAPTPMVTQVIRIGVTPATYGVAQAWTESSPYADKIDLAEYSSNRRLFRAVESGGVQAGIALHDYSHLSFKATPLALAPLVVVVHPSNPVTKLSGEQLQAVFLGTVVDWNDLGGSSSTIQVVIREDGSDARLTFDALILNSRSPDMTAVVMAGDHVMDDYVARTPNAIGYGWLPFVGRNVNIVDVEEGFLPTTPVQAVTYEIPIGAVREWLAWVQTEGQADLSPGFDPLP